jgi:hypothetical protein
VIATNHEKVGIAVCKGIGFRAFMLRKKELQKPDPLQERSNWGERVIQEVLFK